METKNVLLHCSKHIKKKGKSYRYHFDNKYILENRNGESNEKPSQHKKSLPAEYSLISSSVSTHSQKANNNSYTKANLFEKRKSHDQFPL